MMSLRKLHKICHHTLSFALCALLFALCIIPFLAREPSTARAMGYLIGPRDILRLTIYAGGENQQEVDLIVSAHGRINVPFIGSIKAEGVSLSDLESLVAEALARDYFVDPQVNISISEYHSLRYYTSGAVKEPGLYEMTSKATLLELIAKAGGVLPQRGNVAYILRTSTEQIARGKNVVTPSRQEPIKVDLKRLLDKGDMSCNVALQSGDLVYIPFEKAFDVAESKIYVEGKIKDPGVYDYQPGITALNACIMAGGFVRLAAPNRTRIIRSVANKRVVIKINLNDVKKGRIPDVELRPGDLIHVPETWL